MSESRDPAGDSTTTNNMGEVRQAEHQGAAVKAALGANIGVAIAKLLAAFFTGSSAMLSESVHSIADCSNEIVLMVGGRFSKRKTDGDHPFGLYRAKYLASFVVATLLFCLQLYGDFGGCSVMAMGTAKILGIDLIDNFNAPYFSQSIAEFWRRWHISLSTWFRDYLYIPLGGNRKGKGRQLLNIAIVWLLTGLWHGANWNFVLWGVYYAVLLLLEKTFLLKWLDKAPRVVGHVYTCFCFGMGWVLFAITDLCGPYVLRNLCRQHHGVPAAVRLAAAGPGRHRLHEPSQAAVGKAGTGPLPRPVGRTANGVGSRRTAGEHGVSGGRQLQPVFVL